MKQKIIHYLGIAVILLGILTSLIGCQKDDVILNEEEQLNTKTQLILKKSIDVNIDNNFVLSEKLKTLTQKSKPDNPSMHTRHVYNAELDFTIDTDIANYIEYGTYHSYTFEVFRAVENGLTENLLLSLQEDGTYKAFLIAYDLTDNEKEQAQNGIEIDLEGKISASILENQDWVNENFSARGDIGGDGSNCIEFVTTTTNYCETDDGEKIVDNGQVGNDCSRNWTTETVTNLVIDKDCLSSGGNTDTDTGGPDSDTDTGPDNDNNGTSGGGSGTNGNDNEDCVPSIDNPCDDDITSLLIGGQNTKTTDQKNCEELNKLTSPPGYNQPNPYTDDNHSGNPDGLNTTPRLAIVNSDDDELGYESETGFSLRNEGNYPVYGAYAKHIPADSETHHVRFRSRLSQYGTVHVHPINTTSNTWIPMFSLDDIYSVLKIRSTYTSSAMNNANNPNGDALFVSVLIAQQAGQAQTYAIKIDDITKFQKLKNIKENLPKEWRELNKELRENYIDEANNLDGTPTEYQETLLKFLNEHDLGVSLYQMNQTNNGTPLVQESWTKLSLGPADNINHSPCGQ